jgi:hypothetical protein
MLLLLNDDNHKKSYNTLFGYKTGREQDGKGERKRKGNATKGFGMNWR